MLDGRTYPRWKMWRMHWHYKLLCIWLDKCSRLSAGQLMPFTRSPWHSHRDISIYTHRVLCVKFLRPFTYCPKIGMVKNRKFGVMWKILFLLKLHRTIGIDQLTFVYSCRQMDRRGILSLCEYYNLYGLYLLDALGRITTKNPGGGRSLV